MRLSKLEKLVAQLSSGGGAGGLTVIKAVQPGNPATPMALGTDTDADGWPTLVASAAFSPEKSCLVVASMGGFTDNNIAVGQVRLFDGAENWLNSPANSPHGFEGTYSWAATLINVADPIPPLVVPPGDYALELRAGAPDGGVATHLAAFLVVLATA